MAIIAILIFVIFFKLNKSNFTYSTSSTPRNTELDKNVEKKLTGIQIRLNEVMTEISTTTKEQKESLSKVATTVAAAADSIASGATANALTPSTSSLNAEATTVIPAAISNTSLISTEPFASTVFATPSIYASVNASSAIYTNPTRFISQLFSRTDKVHIIRPEFLDIDLDNDHSDKSNSNSDSLGLKLQNHDYKDDTHVINSITADASSGISEPTASSNSNSYHFSSSSSSPNNSRRPYHPLNHNYLDQRQDIDFTFSEPGSRIDDVDRIIQKNKENKDDSSSDRGEKKLFQNQSDNEKDFENIIPSSTNEKNSNPELDKIDEEILTALQRLGGIDDPNDNKDSTNDALK